MLSEEDGKKAVRYAREVIENHVAGREIKTKLGDVFEKKAGSFVTINTYPEKELRGCIGIPEPVMALKKAIKEAAVSATHDPRFPDLKKEELSSVVIEVTVLTPPVLIKVEKPSQYPEHVKIGEDGLIAEKGIWRGLLLPQVAVEYKWNEEEFLSHTCMKAGLAPDAWLDDDTKIYKFQGEVFAEEKPYGNIKKLNLKNAH
ncbi:MAG: TIGR00296 family protein [Thermoplasmata archaeon]|nr:MAG: TIGR00296 family protein [Thermoplasmata archaeon]